MTDGSVIYLQQRVNISFGIAGSMKALAVIYTENCTYIRYGNICTIC